MDQPIGGNRTGEKSMQTISDKVKAVTAGNDEDGVALWLEEKLLGRNR